MHIASLVLGIVSLVFSFFPVWGFILAITALVISIIAMVKKRNYNKDKGFIMAGLVLSIIATIISLLVIIANILVLYSALHTSDEIEEAMNNTPSLQQQIMKSYDNTILSGAQVKSAISQYMTDNDITIILMNKTGTKILATVGAKKLPDNSIKQKNSCFKITSKNYSKEGGNMHKTSIQEFITKGNESYIDIRKEYKSYHLKISNTNNVVGIVFMEK